jgi:hypothetical protein
MFGVIPYISRNIVSVIKGGLDTGLILCSSQRLKTYSTSLSWTHPIKIESEKE